MDQLFKTQVANPLANEIANTGPGVTTGATVPLGDLLLPNPAFGGLVVFGQNIGRANYNAGTVKVQKRLAQGVTFLFDLHLQQVARRCRHRGRTWARRRHGALQQYSPSRPSTICMATALST